MSENLTAEQKEQINAYIFSGQKIQAIKVLREATGLGLAEAKQAVEATEVALRQSAPEKFSAPQGKGCMGSIVLVLIAAASAALWLI